MGLLLTAGVGRFHDLPCLPPFRKPFFSLAIEAAMAKLFERHAQTSYEIQ